jgi:hypothetical protein
MLICRCGLPDPDKSKSWRDLKYWQIPRHLFSAASISPERKLFGSNYDLQGFEKLQMSLSELP